MNRRALLVTLVVVTLAAASSWLSQESGQQAHEEASTLSDRVPDYYMEGFSATSMDLSGRPEHRLEARRLVHYPYDDSTELTQPHLVLFQADSPPWHITAERGKVEAGGELVHLQGGVRMLRPGPEGRELQTEVMRIRPQQRYAETDAPVTVTAPGTVVKAVGMQAYIDEKRLELMSQVRGSYEP